MCVCVCVSMRGACVGGGEGRCKGGGGGDLWTGMVIGNGVAVVMETSRRGNSLFQTADRQTDRQWPDTWGLLHAVRNSGRYRVQ